MKRKPCLGPIGWLNVGMIVLGITLAHTKPVQAQVDDSAKVTSIVSMLLLLDETGSAGNGGAATRYPSDVSLSPITSAVINRLAQIRALSMSVDDDVFMKTGATSTVSSQYLNCFSGSNIDLDDASSLQATIDHYLVAATASEDSWDRDSLAAQIGRSASWAIAGNPSPLEQEVTEIAPRVALVNFGTNDMQLAATFQAAIEPFYDNMETLLDELETQGIIPVLLGLTPRNDSAGAANFVPIYSAITRAIAEARQLPYINQYFANLELPDQGLTADGVNSNVYRELNVAQPCVFTEQGLQFGYNVANFLSLQMLDKVRKVAIDNEPAPDSPALTHSGTGSSSNPFVINELPFTHHADTSQSPNDLIDAYPACDSGQDESGPEYYYRLDISTAKPIRIVALDRDDVDIDVHLLSGAPNAASCIERDNFIIERTLSPGTYYAVLDTFVSADSTENSGRYSLIVVECEPADADC